MPPNCQGHANYGGNTREDPSEETTPKPAEVSQLHKEARSLIQRSDPVPELFQVLRKPRVLAGGGFDHRPRSFHKSVFVLGPDLAAKHGQAQVDEVGVQGIAHAVVVDSCMLAGIPEILDHAATGVHLPRLLKKRRQQMQATALTRGAERSQELHQVQMASLLV